MEFTCTDILPGVRQIGDGLGNFCTLLTGGHGALLYDTMTGLGDLRHYVEELCGRTPAVVNSHCHFDHMGGNFQFDRVHMARADLPLLEVGREEIGILEQTLHRDLTDMTASFTGLDRIVPLDGGEVFDLGGLTAQVVPLPGHTPGCIGLLCPELRLLLAGDALSPQCCIFFPESLPLSDYAALLDAAEQLPFDRFLSAHFDFLFPKSALEKFRACIPLVGVKRGMEYAFPPLPFLKGRIYMAKAMDPELHQPICLITRPEEKGLSSHDA